MPSLNTRTMAYRVPDSSCSLQYSKRVVADLYTYGPSPYQKCHKFYRNSGGLKSQPEHHTDCDKERLKRDRRTDPSGHNAHTRSSKTSEVLSLIL